MIKNKTIVIGIYLVALIMMLMSLVNCSKYQVVSELDVHLYHLHNPKTNKVEVIITEQKLVIGEFYWLKSIKTIDDDNRD